MQLHNGMLVRHASLGVGKVVALEGSAVHVVFAEHDPRLATKLRLPMALSFLTPSPTANAWLTGLTGFALDEKTGRYGREMTWLTHGEAVERFRQEFPKGFQDPAYLEPDGIRSDSGARWRRAASDYAALLGAGKAERFLEEGDLASLASAARKVERHTRALHWESDRLQFETWLRDGDRAKAYWKALLDFIGAARPHRGRFEALAAAVAGLELGDSADSRWRLATLLPFVANPDMHMVLRPRFAREVTQPLGLELVYDAEPNWATYTSLLRVTGELLEKLAPLGARDHVDVEVFMEVAMTRPARLKAEKRAAEKIVVAENPTAARRKRLAKAS